MVDSVNAAGQPPAAGLSNTSADQEKLQQRVAEEQQNAQQTNASDSVTITSDAVEAPESTTQTTIQNADEAQETASRVVSLFQEQPELAATAQGGRVTSEKVDAYLSQNFG